jgi:outer membrane murein-binding lipoprotein Lpp
VKFRAIAAVVVGVALVTGCADTPKLAGSAAIIDGKAISAATVSERIDQVRSQIQITDPGLVSAVPSLVQISQRSVDHFVLHALIEEAAKREGINVTEQDVVSYREDIFAQYTKDAIEAQLVTQNAVPTTGVDEFMFEILVQRALMEKFSPGGTKAAQTQALIDYITNLSQEIGVELNPRYGKWDPSNLMSTPGDKTLSVPLPVSLG